MTEYFDENGDQVEGLMTAEEVAAKIEEEKKAWEEANQTPETKEEEVETPTEVTPEVDPNEPPAWAKILIEQVETLSGNQHDAVKKDVVQALTDEQKTVFDDKYNSLQGYGETPEEIRRRANDAYLLTTGQPFSSNEINMANVMAAGGGRVTPAPVSKEVDKGIQSALGISEEDVTKYGNK